MPVLNIAFSGTEELARSIAKRSDVRDIESYVYKEVRAGTTQILSLLRPLKHPERLRPLLSVLNVAKVGLVEVTKVDTSLGEILVAFGCAGIEVGHVIINPEQGGWVDPDQVKIILSQAGLGNWKLHESAPDEHDLREQLFAHLNEVENDSDGDLIIPVDQHFNVKGVGLVAIGYVQSGTVNKHETVQVLPANENGIVRSLQVMDDDVDAAVSGDRVGLALRNLREEALHRGCMIIHLETNSLEKHKISNFKLIKAPFQNRDLHEEDIVHAAVDMQFTVGRIKTVNGEDITVEWESPLWLRSKSSPPVIITQLDAAPMRIIGVANSIHSA
jgi:selenocysteine-specific translation elongation factor